MTGRWSQHFKWRERKATTTLVLLRNVATDDPEGQEVFESLLRHKGDRIHILTIEQIRSCNRSLAIIELVKGHLAVRINALTFRPTSIDTYKAFTGAVARSIFGFPPPLRRQISRSTGTEDFLLDRDYLISEFFNFANPPKNIAKNENSKNINIIKPNKNRATTNIKNFASKLL